MNAIAAMTKNRVIGKGLKLPWPKIPDDMEHFRLITEGGNLVFGANTFKGLSNASVLSMIKDRTIYVLTRDPSWLLKLTGAKFEALDKKIFTIQDIDEIPDKNTWVCGGAKVYECLLPACEAFFLTLINKEYEGDVLFPPFEDDFILIEEAIKKDDTLSFRFYLNRYGIGP